MFPELSLSNIVEEQKKDENSSRVNRTYLYDFKKGDFILKNGRLVEVEGIEALKVWIEKILKTEKFKFKIYQKEEEQDEYGFSIKNLMGRKLPPFFIESELKRLIVEALKRHDWIHDIDNFTIVQEGVKFIANFTVILKDGDLFSQEVSL